MSYSVMIKPASSACNLRCSYCFYADTAQERETASYGMMSRETAQTVIRAFLERARRGCFFAFQGGEPTLRGLDFFTTLWSRFAS